jgi:hypothetical protein
MKTLKFKPHLIRGVLDGNKTITWRLFDDKDLQEGDKLECLNSENGNKFAEVEIIKVENKRVEELTEEDLKRNEYRDNNHVLELNKKYYGNQVNINTIVKIIEFKLLTTKK